HHAATTYIYTLSLHDALPIFSFPGHSILILSLLCLPISPSGHRRGKSEGRNCIRPGSLTQFRCGGSQKNCPFPAKKYLFERFCRSEEHTSELQSRENLVCRLL